MKLWLTTEHNTLLNADHVRYFYEKAGCDEPEDMGLYAVLDYEWKPQHRTIKLKIRSLNDLAEYMKDASGHFIVGNIKALDPVDV